MTDEEKQLMMAMLMRQEEEPVDPGGHMIPLTGGQGAPGQYSDYQGRPVQAQGGMSPSQIARQFSQGGGPAAGTAGGPLTGAEAANMAIPTGAPDSLAAGSDFAPAASGGGESALGSASTWAAPAAAMAGLIYGGEKLDIGAGKQGKEFNRPIKSYTKEIGRQAKDVEKALKFWEWF